MPLVPFAPWRPDVATLNSNFTSDVSNVLLAADSYIPFPILSPYSEALPSQPMGAVTVRDSSETIHIFVGTADKLYKFNSTTRDWDHVSKLAADQVTNGTFASDTGWTKDTGVTIAAGVGTFTSVASGDGLSQSQSFTAGTIYKVVFKVSGFSAGGVRPVISGGTSVNGTTRTANGTFTEYLTAVSGNNTFELEAVGTTTLDVDDVTVEALTNYNSTAEERWRFKQFGDYVVAVNVNTAPQVFELGVSNEFSDLGGSPPNARHIAVWGDHLGLMNSRTATWSDTDNITNWTTGNAGSQTFPDGGNIQGSTDATNPLILQRDAIRLATFVPGSNEVFTFQKIHDRRGAASPYSIATRGEFTFFADAGAFYQITPNGQIIPIGFEKVDRTIFSTISGDNLTTIFGEVDPFYTRVYFAVRINSASDVFDTVIVYDWNIGEWTQIDAGLDIFMPLASGTLGYTLEGLDAISASLDALAFSLDSRVWQGGAPVLAAFDSDNKLGFFAGDNAEATLTTQEMGSTDGGVTMLSSVYPVVDTNDVYVSFGTRMLRGDAIAWSGELQPSSATGRVDRVNASRFHTFKMRVPAGTMWDHAQGVDAATKRVGMR